MPQTISATIPAVKAEVEIPLEEISFLPSPKQFFILLLIYLGLHLIFRTLVSETAGIDEAHQLVIGQKFQWGYGPHAPLYTWLMILFLHVFSPKVINTCSAFIPRQLTGYSPKSVACRDLFTRPRPC